MSLNISLWQLKSCHGNCWKVCLFLRLRVCMWRGWAPETEYVSLERLEPKWLVATCCDLPQGHKSINEAGIFQLLVSHLSHFCHPDSLYHMVEEEIWTLTLKKFLVKKKKKKTWWGELVDLISIFRHSLFLFGWRSYKHVEWTFKTLNHSVVKSQMKPFSGHNYYD